MIANNEGNIPASFRASMTHLPLNFFFSLHYSYDISVSIYVTSVCCFCSLSWSFVTFVLMDFDPICAYINTIKIDQWICRYQLPITDYVKSSEAFGFLS